MKTYRVYRVVNAENEDEALEKVDASVMDAIRDESTVANIFTAEVNPFTPSDEGTILELARVSLSDAEIYDYFADKLDLSDEEMKTLQKKIEEATK